MAPKCPNVIARSVQQVRKLDVLNRRQFNGTWATSGSCPLYLSTKDTKGRRRAISYLSKHVVNVMASGLAQECAFELATRASTLRVNVRGEEKIAPVLPTVGRNSRRLLDAFFAALCMEAWQKSIDLNVLRSKRKLPNDATIDYALMGLLGATSHL